MYWFFYCTTTTRNLPRSLSEMDPTRYMEFLQVHGISVHVHGYRYGLFLSCFLVDSWLYSSAVDRQKDRKTKDSPLAFRAGLSPPPLRGERERGSVGGLTRPHRK